MKRAFIKALSVLLVVTILATSLPFSTLAAEENTKNNQNISTDMGDMSFTATNSFGEMMTDSLSEYTGEQNGEYYISDIEYEGYCALVTFATQQGCTIMVAAYEEDTGRMITSASIDVFAEDTEAFVEFEDELPDYFVLKAFMLDDNAAPLCKAYTCNEMTKVYEDFAATTIDDYDEDKVINLDKDETTNFLVMSDETSTITNDGRTNVLVSYDEETGVYTFGNIDEQITSLKKDDIFYFDNGNVEELTFIKVGAVDIDGTTAYITEAEASLEEVFDVVKIDNKMTSGEFALNEDEELEEGVTYLGCEEVEEPDDEISTYAWESDKSITFKHNFELKKEIKPKEPNKISNNVSLTGKISISGTAGVTVKGTFKYYISKEFSEIEFTITPSIGLNISLEGVGRLEVKLKSFDISPCAGVYVGISPKIIVEASVKASFDATLKFTVGFGFNSKDGLVNKTKKPSFKPEFKIEGEIFVGVDLAPNVSVISKKILRFELGTEIGAKLTATISTNNGDLHECNSCLDGDIDLVGSLSGKIVFGEGTKWKKDLTVTFLDIKIDIVNFYFSFTYDEFGWGNCPYSSSDNTNTPGSDDSDGNDDDSPFSGNCGENAYWSFDESTGTLTISGTGAMNSYNYYNRPWESYEYSIKKVVINNGVTTIGNYAFSDCDSLTSITIPDSVTTIGDYAFHHCDSLTSITIPDSVTTIGDYAFYDCKSLTSITIPDSVTTIGDYAFAYCDSLTSITVDSNNKSYSSDEYGVLFNKDKTTLIQYPTGNARTSYTIPDSVTTIGNDAFYDCDSLTSITIPDSVTTIGNYAFAYCDSLTSITIPDSVTTIGNDAFYDCDSLTSITIPDSVTTIGDDAFAWCDSLTSITIPDSVTTIGDDAFAWCDSLTDVIIGDSVTTIGYSAFEYCSSLTDVYYSGTEEQWNKISIGSDNENLTNATIHYNSTGTTYSLKSKQPKMMSFAMAKSSELTVYSATASNAILGNEYVIVVLNDTADINDFTNNELLYIDQKTAEADGDITFNYVPKTDDDCIVYIIGIFSDTNSVKQELITPTNSNEPENPDYNFNFHIQQPSRTTIRNKDTIILHAIIDGTVPEGSYIEWDCEGYFSLGWDIGNNYDTYATAEDKGYDTITATLYDADGKVLATDYVELYSKSGFFDKIGGFFRSLFGITKTYDN